ncbi:MAG TPA: DsbA family oxidoreductase [Cyclobacteriaceae bacterium]|jgi:predicted DsbA family dithiol-disulfide isomerase|nr:DsbA family oxidoreductase [Cyclobacteriaceae bacterium]
MQKPKIKIDIVSDVVCPWCYIGKRRLEKAVDQLKDKYEFELEYHPFELNPGMPVQGVNQKEYLSDKFGGEERYHQITDHTTGVAATEGLAFNFQKQTTSPNTRASHTIIQLAKEEGVQLPIMEAFFKAYFTDGVDLSKNENIIAVAVAAGLQREVVEKRLADDDAKVRIAVEEKEMSKLGITGVPFYIIDNKYGISGAQNAETFIKAFEEIGAPLITSEEACDIDGKNC